jgi:hypothetical protein
MLCASREHEKQVSEAVQIHQKRASDGFALRQGQHAALGASSHRAG